MAVGPFRLEEMNKHGENHKHPVVKSCKKTVYMKKPQKVDAKNQMDYIAINKYSEMWSIKLRHPLVQMLKVIMHQ